MTDSTRRSLLRLVGAGALAGMAGDLQIETGRVAGQLSIHIEPGVYSVGDFEIHLTDDPQFVIHHPDADGPLWASVPGENVIEAAEATLEITERRGSFEMDESVVVACRTQTVERIAVDDGLTVRGTLQAPNGAATGYELTFEQVSTGHLSVRANVDDERFSRLRLRWESTPTERFYGFGEQYSHLDMKGKEVPIVVEEQGVTRTAPVRSVLVNLAVPGAAGTAFSSYAPMPYTLSSRGYALFLENTAYTVFDLRYARVASTRTYASELTARIVAGRTPLQRVERYTDYTGRMPVIPAWLNRGAVVGLQGGTEKVRRVWDELRARDTPIAAFWLQDWVGQRQTSFGSQLWWNWELDEGHYPNWNQLVADLGNAGVSVMGYINPYLVDVSEKPRVDRNLLREAREGGYLVGNDDGEPYTFTVTDFDAAIVDLSDPAARAWLRGVIREELLGIGFDGWMADFGEALPFECELATADSATYHNRYPVAWAALNRRVIREVDRAGEVVFFTRSGFTRSPAHSTLFWEGDQTVLWSDHDGFGTAIRGLLTGGLSGIALNHSDTGGYTALTQPVVGFTRGTELLERWTEANAFTAVLRTHEGNKPDANAQIYDDDRALDHFARFATVYAILADYRRDLLEEATARGVPVVRHPLLHYPNDRRAHRIEDQFMLGREFMIAPILEKGATGRTVYLPGERWTHVWSGERFDAGKHWIHAPIGEPPVFYRTGSAAGERFVESLSNVD